jgi:2-methylcitrate dehydratase PrpD
MTSDGVPATHALADFSRSVTRRDLPENVVAFLRNDLIVAVTSASRSFARQGAARCMTPLYGLAGTPTCSLMFRRQSTDPVRAALLNGFLMGERPLTKAGRTSSNNLTAAIWPAALAAAEFSAASGDALITAVAVGWEAAARLHRSLGPDHEERGFSTIATCGTFGAAVATGRLFDLDRDSLLNTIGLAASYAGGLRSDDDANGANGVLVGLAAAAGIEVACMARVGLTGPPDAIEGAQGFGRAVSDSFDAAMVLDQLEATWVVASDISEFEPAQAREAFRSSISSIRPEADPEVWLAKVASLDALGRASELVIR